MGTHTVEDAMLLLLALGCVDTTEPIRGTIRVGPGTVSPPADGATLTIYDDDLELYSRTETAQDGTFSVEGPRGGTVYAEVHGPDFVRSGFVGAVGQGPFDVPDGELFAWTNDAMDALRARYAGCAVQEGGVIHGELRLFGAEGDGGSPVLRTGFARLLTSDGAIEACYLDDQGIGWNEGAFITGETGQYALFGVEPGLHRIEFGYFIQEVPVLHELTVFVPEDGIAPQFPAWVDLVGQ